MRAKRRESSEKPRKSAGRWLCTYMPASDVLGDTMSRNPTTLNRPRDENHMCLLIIKACLPLDANLEPHRVQQRSGIMTLPCLEPKPGKTIKAVIQENTFLNEFMVMMTKRIELEKRYVRDLEALKCTRNAEWSKPNIWSLISPWINYMDDEIECHKEACDGLSRSMDKVAERRAPDLSGENGFSALDMPECLESAYSQFQKCQNNVASSDSLADLNAYWKKRRKSPHISATLPLDSSRYVLPETDREYRRAVVNQQRVVHLAHQWYKDKLVDIMDSHQQYAEDIKVFSYASMNILSKRTICASTLCSTAINSTTAFSSIDFIAMHQNDKERETSHPLLIPVVYHNFMRDAIVARPIFGLAIDETTILVKALMDSLGDGKIYFSASWTSNRRWVDRAFGLEVDYSRNPLLEVLSRQETPDIRWYLAFCMYSNPPLVPVDVESIETGASISRSKIDSYLIQPPGKERRKIMNLAFVVFKRLKASKEGNMICTWLSHNQSDGAVCLWSKLWQKWDFENDCPLPQGVKREWDEGRSVEILRDRVGRVYKQPDDE